MAVKDFPFRHPLWGEVSYEDGRSTSNNRYHASNRIHMALQPTRRWRGRSRQRAPRCRRGQADHLSTTDRMTKKKREKPFHLDMSFDEALRRYVQTDQRELPVPQP